MHTATLYTRAGCHLCDAALAVLLRYGLRPDVIDIDHDSDLVARYGDCVPVVLIDGRLRFRGRVEERLLRRLLRPPSLRSYVINLFRWARLR